MVYYANGIAPHSSVLAIMTRVRISGTVATVVASVLRLGRHVSRPAAAEGSTSCFLDLGRRTHPSPSFRDRCGSPSWRCTWLSCKCDFAGCSTAHTDTQACCRSPACPPQALDTCNSFPFLAVCHHAVGHPAVGAVLLVLEETS